MTNRNDLTDLERSERLLELRKAQLERELPADGRDRTPGDSPDAGRWREYVDVVTALTALRSYLRPPTSDKRRRPAD